MKRARIIITLVLAIKKIIQNQNKMAKKTVKETTEETTVEETVETTKVEETPQTGHPSRDFHTPLTQESNG